MGNVAQGLVVKGSETVLGAVEREKGNRPNMRYFVVCLSDNPNPNP